MKDNRSFKYRFLLALCRLFKLQRVMELPPEKAKKLFEKAYKGVLIPKLNDPEFDIDTASVMGSTCIFYKHISKCRKAGIYLVGGGMLKYPKPSQAKEVLRIAKTTGRDFVLPFYPLVHTGNTLPDVYKMVFALYKQLLREYVPENICILGGSSGANLALGFISYINDIEPELPKPGKVYAGSPGSLLISGVHVTLEIESGLYHAYACMPLVKDAMPGYQRMLEYIGG